MNFSINDVCSVCNQPLDQICVCEYPPAKVCAAHHPTHESKSPSLAHTYWPISRLQFLQRSESLSAARQKEAQLARLRLELMAQVSDMKACEDEVERVFANIIEQVTVIRGKRLAELSNKREQLRHEVEGAYREAMDHMLEVEYHPNSRLALEIWRGGPVTYQPFKSKIKPEAPALDLISNLVAISWSSLGPMENVQLAYVHENTLKTFSEETKVWNSLPLSQPVDVSQKSSYAFLASNSVFACGGDPALTSTYELNCHTGAVETLSSLARARNLPGLAVVQEAVYVFCGKDDRGMCINACEFLPNLKSSWAALPNARYKRWCFNPCTFADRVYLIGGNPQNGAELFSTTAKTFEPLGISLDSGVGLTTALVVGEELVVVNKNAVHRWRLDSLQGRKDTIVGAPEKTTIHGSLPPYWSQGKLVVLQAYARQLHEIDLEACTLVSQPL